MTKNFSLGHPRPGLARLSSGFPGCDRRCMLQLRGAADESWAADGD